MATSLLDLPPELRLIIYKFAMPDHQYNAEGKLLHPHTHLNLIQICRLIRHETFLPLLRHVHQETKERMAIAFRISEEIEEAHSAWDVERAEVLMGRMNREFASVTGIHALLEVLKKGLEEDLGGVFRWREGGGEKDKG
ncbi:hypothetical protein KC332_g4246 [Hortaea werneckii]|nr:hypothetical protein KC358_g10990 [Hortaea werneckii]KAI6830928.1 hypothetical protein KC350_g7462 [Hortaea werneckii]KAI6930723.1 hypothetical protein KC341_g10045 [Hortaea werneckii]KAI6942781.1 hypothetical protein KC348_g4383 [Hortaea werneckii]KAI6967197.1 hypothetical protein KC321_g9152 [Hortaea werneckii]